MISRIAIFLCTAFLFNPVFARAEAPIGDGTRMCIECHAKLNPGIVKAWEKSRMSRFTPAEAARLPALNKRVSFEKLSESLSNVVVGCAECHGLSPDSHADTFEHNGFEIHTVVTPGDCARCHPVEAEQFGKNLMSHAYGNLQNNPVYRSLADSVTGVQIIEGLKSKLRSPDPETDADSCFYCHGTVVEVKGSETRETVEGEMTFPVLTGWPNQGIGRINPDGSKGSCSACHTRHLFSVATARKPHTCSECHKGPDVPAYKVFNVSKHGNIYASHKAAWNFESVPWVAGKDFTAPTCATCHISLITDDEEELIAERTHRMNDRLAWRIFGLIYAHPHPKSPDTAIIQNAAGLPLPTELTGEPAGKWLIDTKTQEERRNRMQEICLSCHGRSWVNGQFARFENTIKTTNEMTLAATKIMLSAWETGAAAGLSQKDGIFNETLEMMWVEQWLFYGNSTRYASAMAGADYGSFADGRWHLSRNIREMLDFLKIKTKRRTTDGQ